MMMLLVITEEAWVLLMGMELRCTGVAIEVVEVVTLEEEEVEDSMTEAEVAKEVVLMVEAEVDIIMAVGSKTKVKTMEVVVSISKLSCASSLNKMAGANLVKTANMLMVRVS